MSCFSLPKKLKQLPSSSKKAWNSFTSSLAPKLHNLRNRGVSLPKSFSKTATRLLQLRRKRHHSIPRRTASRGGRSFYYYKQYNTKYQHLQPYSSGPNSPATVYIDRLFGESCSSSSTSKGTTEASTSGGSTLKDDGGGGSGCGRGVKKREKVRNNWKEYLSSMPNIRGVDERADEFITKFREQMQLQREQSLIEFQEMLARTA